MFDEKMKVSHPAMDQDIEIEVPVVYQDARKTGYQDGKRVVERYLSIQSKIRNGEKKGGFFSARYSDSDLTCVVAELAPLMEGIDCTDGKSMSYLTGFCYAIHAKLHRVYYSYLEKMLIISELEHAELGVNQRNNLALACLYFNVLNNHPPYVLGDGSEPDLAREQINAMGGDLNRLTYPLVENFYGICGKVITHSIRSFSRMIDRIIDSSNEDIKINRAVASVLKCNIADENNWTLFTSSPKVIQVGDSAEMCLFVRDITDDALGEIYASDISLMEEYIGAPFKKVFKQSDNLYCLVLDESILPPVERTVIDTFRKTMEAQSTF
ncbi:hypothetical protein [Motilimonas sp. KMU-193]|uniref:hypothetical protein n=1 Tax=Motilimonas sp. KMU-193 TaxID=3388668 RepID=UPI00396B23F5